jgi:hypothetical protein
MAYRIPSERVEIAVTEELTIEVERLAPGPLHQGVLAGLAEVFAPKAKPDALGRVETTFIAFAQPTWEIVDRYGVVHATTEGMARLPIPLRLAMLVGWVETTAEKTTAADELLPEGPLRDEVNRHLRSVRKAA